MSCDRPSLMLFICGFRFRGFVVVPVAAVVVAARPLPAGQVGVLQRRVEVVARHRDVADVDRRVGREAPAGQEEDCRDHRGQE